MGIVDVPVLLCHAIPFKGFEDGVKKGNKYNMNMGQQLDTYGANEHLIVTSCLRLVS